MRRSVCVVCVGAFSAWGLVIIMGQDTGLSKRDTPTKVSGEEAVELRTCRRIKVSDDTNQSKERERALLEAYINDAKTDIPYVTIVLHNRGRTLTHMIMSLYDGERLVCGDIDVSLFHFSDALLVRVKDAGGQKKRDSRRDESGDDLFGGDSGGYRILLKRYANK